MIPVTKPFLPPKKEYIKYIDGIWERQWLTNMGPLSNELEVRLGEHLSVDHLLFVANGTIALQMAIKAFDLKGKIITTPFSFVATTSSIVWEGCIPVFVDIDTNSFNIDVTKIEPAITEDTCAILATHVYGNPCDVEAIDKLAKKYGLKVIYDAAHAFGVEINGKSIFQFGDISIGSLHATKLYHSVEGGIVICSEQSIYQKLKYIRNFGISGFDSFAELGINGKNSEFHAAMGLVNMNYIQDIYEKRKLLADRYERNLKESVANLETPLWNPYATKNFAYYPVLFNSEDMLLQCIETLLNKDIQTRRYFYPSLASSLPYLNPVQLPVTDSISRRVLCLPFYYDLSFEEVDVICDVILSLFKNK